MSAACPGHGDLPGGAAQARAPRGARTAMKNRTLPTNRTLLALSAGAFALLAPLQCVSQDTGSGLTAVEGIRVGHYTLPGAATGCTVIIAEGGAMPGGDVRGGAPGTVETDLLDPVNSVDFVNAVFLSGGSAFGLATA